MEPEELKNRTQEIFGTPPQNFKMIIGGGNNRLYSFYIHNRPYIAKNYFSSHQDNRNRQQVEYTALTFLHKNGLKNVPCPVHSDHRNNFAVYSFIKGKRLGVHNISHENLKQLNTFLIELNRLGKVEGADELSSASAACLSLKSYQVIIKKRFHRLKTLEQPHTALSTFLENDFYPLYQSVLERARIQANTMKIHWDTQLPQMYLTLSPSDYGFHNALLVEDKTVYFLDFEYFGWDDPAKMICDFLWHPAMLLPGALKSFFFKNIINGLKHIPGLKERTVLCSPLVGLIWCLILLNEFIPEEAKRRTFADIRYNIPQAQQKQLTRAQEYLRRVTDEHNSGHLRYAT